VAVVATTMKNMDLDLKYKEVVSVEEEAPLRLLEDLHVVVSKESEEEVLMKKESSTISTK
jgi:hypothetical protein